MLFSSSLLAFAALSSCVQSAPTSGFAWNSIEHIVAFGDSWTFVQGSAGMQNYSFIGDGRPGKAAFTPQQLLNDKMVAGYLGTSAGGANWVQHLTNCGVEPGSYSPTTCNNKTGGSSQKELWDFAFAGARYADQFNPRAKAYTMPMVNQTQQYMRYGQPALQSRFRKDRSDVLVTVWIGINDISTIRLTDAEKKGLNNDQQLALLGKKYNAINSGLFQQSVAPLYNAGYRNFLFMNMPPYERAPPNLINPVNAYPNKKMVTLWNQGLQNLVTAFQQRAGGRATAMLYDANAFLNQVLDHPSKYGIVDTTTTCKAAQGNPEVGQKPSRFGCLPLDKYFWFNAGHITSRVHELLAEDLKTFLQARK